MYTHKESYAFSRILVFWEYWDQYQTFHLFQALFWILLLSLIQNPYCRVILRVVEQYIY